MLSSLWKNFIQVFGNNRFQTKMIAIMLTMLFVMLLAFPLFVNFYVNEWRKNLWRVHLDEVQVRDWIASVHGSIESRIDPERHITIVRLNKCNITDDDLIRLVPLSHLRELDLSNTDITDEAIPTILSIKSLQYLTIKDTKITPKGVMQIVKERPDMSVDATIREVHPVENE